MAYRDQRTIHKTLNNLLMYEIYLPKTKNNNNTQSKQKHIPQTYDLLVPFSYRFECQKLVLVGDPKVSAFLRVILLPGHPFLLNFSSKHLNCFPLFVSPSCSNLVQRFRAPSLTMRLDLNKLCLID